MLGSDFGTSSKSSATGNQSFGYIAGGSGFDPSVGTVYSTSIERIDYSGDTATALVKGNLSIGGEDGAATGNCGSPKHSM